MSKMRLGKITHAGQNSIPESLCHSNYLLLTSEETLTFEFIAGTLYSFQANYTVTTSEHTKIYILIHLKISSME